MNRTLTTGQISELRLASRCLELGWSVYQPIGVERHDLLIERGEGFERIQVKTGRLERGCIVFNTASNAEGVGRPVGYRGEAEQFGIYAPALDRYFMVPVTEIGMYGGSLRVSPARNGQTKRVRWAVDHELPQPT